MDFQSFSSDYLSASFLIWAALVFSQTLAIFLLTAHNDVKTEWVEVSDERLEPESEATWRFKNNPSVVRDAEQIPENTTVITVLGDSFTWAIGVPREES